MLERTKTPQEEFWEGDFGDDYIDRNNNAQLLASKLNFFSKALRQAGPVKSCLEFGANIGLNLKALQLLYPDIHLQALEINSTAAKQLKTVIGDKHVFEEAIFDYPISGKVELALIKGVLIHINPDMLECVYEKLYQVSSRLILIAEYYNPVPVAIPYRGHVDRLFKRDFAGELLDKYPDLQLVDYGFCYRRDPAFPGDDGSWFLLRKD